MKRPKKPNKQQREAARAEKADLYNAAFMNGYGVGYEQGKREALEKEASK
jgi:hypothetical protein